MKKYYLHDGSTQTGPYSLEDLKVIKVKGDTPIWYAGLDNWKVVSDVEELKPLFSAPPPFMKSIDSVNELDFEAPKRSNRRLLVFSSLGAILLILLLVWFISTKNENEQLAQQLTASTQQIQVETQKKEQAEKDKKEKLAAATKRNMEYRNNWYKYINVGTKNYKAYGLGGIEDVVLQAVNNTEFPLDLVVVELTYWKENGDVFKTETVSIADVAAKNSVLQDAPGSTRGTRLSVEIVKVTARKFSFCFDRSLLPGTDGVFGDNRNPIDPWKCSQ